MPAPAPGAAAGLALDLDDESVRHPGREQAEQQGRENRAMVTRDGDQGSGTGEQGEATHGPDACTPTVLHTN
ncbi:hypothetical protein ACTI_21480 [Actinoplanes sp. OR16]|nr:hypothetical protein ACTI_21480 [Actinoplanes sp. OR16]